MPAGLRRNEKSAGRLARARAVVTLLTRMPTPATSTSTKATCARMPITFTLRQKGTTGSAVWFRGCAFTIGSGSSSIDQGQGFLWRSFGAAARDGGRSGGSRSCASPLLAGSVEGEAVDQAALVVLGVDAALEAEHGAGAEVAVEDLAVVAHRLDGVVEGVGAEAERLDVRLGARGAQQAQHLRVLGVGAQVV